MYYSIVHIFEYSVLMVYIVRIYACLLYCTPCISVLYALFVCIVCTVCIECMRTRGKQLRRNVLHVRLSQLQTRDRKEEPSKHQA